MNNVKMGEIIREARKKKGLTQKDIATHLHITDRAVSKWERGICAPDLSLLEPLSEIVDLSITELITGEIDNAIENDEKVELVVKETIQYSKQIKASKKKENRNMMIKAVIVGFFLCVSSLIYLLHIGYFYKEGTYTSPDGSMVSTVYNCNLNDDHFFPTKDAFTIKTGSLFAPQLNNIFGDAEFRGLWWSPDSSRFAVSMYREDNIELVIIQGLGWRILTYDLEDIVYENDYFSRVVWNEDYRAQITFDFLQWSNEKPTLMLLYYSYYDAYGIFHDGYLWYDYESKTVSGEIEIY